jgi:lysophospholipase L1-like esterase
MAAAWLCGCSNDAPPATGTSAPPVLTGSAGVAAASASSGAAGTGLAARSGSAGAGSGIVGAAGTSTVSPGQAGRAGTPGNMSMATAGITAGGGGGGRAGVSDDDGSDAGMAPAAAGSGGSAASADKVKPPCLKKGSQVVFIGDSYINYDVAHTLLSTLIEQRAVKDGALKQGDHYRNYAVPGTALAAPNILGMIAPQWDQAKSEDPDIKAVIMDGGGNDVLIDHMECLAAGSAKDSGCQQVVADTLRVGTDLITNIRNSGVNDDIYFFYPHVPAGGDDINDYALALLQTQAMSLATPTFRTYVLDLIPIFDGHADWIADDGIHANDTGENKMADEIWQIMKTNCIGQAESSGCCAP